MRWNPTHQWIYSTAPAHEPIIDEETFEQVQLRLAAGARHRGVTAKPRASKRGYLLSGLLYCGLCGRRMVGSFNNNRNHYRCTYTAEYANANSIAHPRSLYLREDHVVDLVDPWIGRAFAPVNLQHTLQALADAQHDETTAHRIAAAREKIGSCQTKLDRYRAALEAGTDPTLIQQWTTQIKAEQATAEADLRQLTGRRTMTSAEINTVVDALAGIATVLRRADPADKAEVYRQLGLKLTYEPGPRIITAEAHPNRSCTRLCPRGDLNPHALSGTSTSS